jgi:anthranilate phosphoribosyltransferase
MKEVLHFLFDKNILTRESAKETLLNIGQGKYTESEIASFLTVYLMRKITPEELAGFREALLDLCVAIDLSDFKTIDVCGTGGDEKHTFNISTLSAFMLAGAGIRVVKHGNYAVSSSSGSSNILEYFGYKFSNNQEKLRNEIEKTNLCYMHAPLFHPAMRFVGPVRKGLKMKTFFNLLGPMINPCRPNHQVMGVYSEEAIELCNQVFKSAGINYFILYSLDGYDEISLTGDFRVASAGKSQNFSPESIGMDTVLPEEIHGGKTVDDAAKIFADLLEGKGSKAQQDVAVVNAAFAMNCYYPEKSIRECIELSRESLISGKAKKTLERLVSMQ